MWCLIVISILRLTVYFGSPLYTSLQTPRHSILLLKCSMIMSQMHQLKQWEAIFFRKMVRVT